MTSCHAPNHHTDKPLNPIYFMVMRQNWLPYAKTNAPRYTSYPTAVQFNENTNLETATDWMKSLNPDEAISVYTHIPFCEKLCWYCGCHTTIPNGYDRIGRYFETLLKEVQLWKEELGQHAGASHVHFGGGTPNALNADHMLQLLDALHDAFRIREDAEIAIELDPRTLDLNMIRSLAAGGVNRASLGVQDFDLKVQQAVNRVQPFELVRESVERLRNWGIRGLNFDLLYGLPFQTADTVRDTALKAAKLAPDRISAFGYAHVPWFAKHQKAIDENVLPDTEARFALFNVIAETLKSEGYVAIGLDHFAREDDPLAKALSAGSLKRNFQGYTDDACDTLIAMGASGISEFRHGYCQNLKNIRDWSECVESGKLPIQRGVPVSDDDRLRRKIIEKLMCDMSVDVEEICQQQGHSDTELDECFEFLKPLANDDICHIDGSVVSVPDDARIFLRSVAQAFDKYASPSNNSPRHAKAV